MHPNEWIVGKNEGIAYTPLRKLLNVINILEAWGLLNKKIQTKNMQPKHGDIA